MDKTIRFRATTGMQAATVAVLTVALMRSAMAICPAPGTNQVVVYKDANLLSTCAVLEIGNYPVPPFGAVGNDAISEIFLGANVTVDMFQNSQFGGNVYHYENGSFIFTLNGWANDDVSSIIVRPRSNPLPTPDTHTLYQYSAASTNFASNSNTVYVDVGTVRAGSTVRMGTCSGGGDLPSASASGDTYLRVLFNGVEQGLVDDSCGSVSSYMSYTVPYTGDVTIAAGCYANGFCTGNLEVAIGLPDSNGSVSDVLSSFTSIIGNAPQRNKLNFGQNNAVRGAYTNHNLFTEEPHFQSVVRVPRNLPSTSDSSPMFLLSGSDNADLFTVTFGAAQGAPGLVGPLPDTPTVNSRVIGAESVGSYYDSRGMGHLGGMQASGRWLGGGVEQGGGPGPSTIWIWDLWKLPNPVVAWRVENPTGSAGGIALTKRPGVNSYFLMFVAGQSPTTAQVWSLAGPNGYANMMAGGWVNQQAVTLPSVSNYGFQNLSFINQDNGDLFLVGTLGVSDQVESGADTAVLMKVTENVPGNPAGGFTVQQVASRVYVCDFDSSRQCAFNAAGTMFVDADRNVLRLYASKAYRPDDGNAPMTFVEYY